MLDLPEVAQSPTVLEVDHAASAPTVTSYYASQHQYVEQQPFPTKGGYVGVDEVPSSPSLICGVRRSTFWLAIILAFVVVAAAVGGGVGGSLAVSNARSRSDNNSASSIPIIQTITKSDNDSPSSTPTIQTITKTESVVPTLTSTEGAEPPYVPKAPSEVLRINNNCPESLISLGDHQYNCRNKTDYGGGDIMWFTAYTLDACITACETYNEGRTSNVRCKGVSLAEDLSQRSHTNRGANCWLKQEVDEKGQTVSQMNTLAWLAEDS